MRIEFRGGYLLRSDTNNWIVAQTLQFASGKRAGESYESLIGFYPTLPAALTGLLDHKLRQSDAASLQELKTLIGDFRVEVAEQLSTEVVA